MRYLLFVLLLFPFLVQGQDGGRILSNYEKFSTPTGKIYKTETKEIRKAKDVTVSLVRTTDIESKKSITAILVYQKSISTLYPGELGAAYIDIDEVAGVADALKYYQSQVKTVKSQDQNSFTYSTTNKVQFSCFYVEGGSTPGWSVSISQPFHPKNSAGGLTTLKGKDIEDLAEALAAAKSASF